MIKIAKAILQCTVYFIMKFIAHYYANINTSLKLHCILYNELCNTL